jgi:putative component of membrane protein insertase Oxa1/YidC/SpoIIIJ protein YidD
MKSCITDKFNIQVSEVLTFRALIRLSYCIEFIAGGYDLVPTLLF